MAAAAAQYATGRSIKLGPAGSGPGGGTRRPAATLGPIAIREIHAEVRSQVDSRKQTGQLNIQSVSLRRCAFVIKRNPRLIQAGI